MRPADHHFDSERFPKENGNFQARNRVEGRSAAALIVVCVLGVIGLLLVGGVVALFIPVAQNTRQAARRVQCGNNLKQIGIAMHNYHDVHKSFPAASVNDPDGKPMHSWRVSILPYVEQGPLFNQYDFNRPWNSPENAGLGSVHVPVYSCPENDPERNSKYTSYMAVVGPGLAFESGAFHSLAKFTDGSTNTILLVEVANSKVTWNEPKDLTEEEFLARTANGTLGPHPGGVQVLLADGSVRFLSSTVARDTLHNMLTRGGGEFIRAEAP